MYKNSLYRKCVAIVVFDSVANKCLVGKRAGTDNSWQFPQGGVDDGESCFAAAGRELFEEMGIRGCILDRTKNFDIDICCVANIQQAIDDHDFDNFNKSYMPSVQFAKYVGPYRYDYPTYVNRKELGQEQTWFLAHKNGFINIMLNEEFSDYQWMFPKDIIDNIVAFKKDVYISALRDLGLI